MDGHLNLVTAPAALLTTALAKSHLRVSGSTDDTYIDTILTVAVSNIENMVGRSLLHTVWDWVLADWPSPDEWFPRAPLATITHVKYLDNDGVQQTLAASQYIAMHAGAYKTPGKLHRAYNVAWPDHRPQANAIEVRFTAGYHATAAASVPPELVHAVKLLVEHLYDNRSPVVVGTIIADIPAGLGLEQLIAPFKLRRF
jgi:uncharacterized phiE125 gp8 family phage protein